ncbi:hypothetical protein [Afifella pfennigii]|uniref:hypothetical protein n=1 Tax=Afifella pfennigii TaxID=209897 RepID=UPI0006914CA2|nr:hypothetical protein [Afifella pfennigii]
MNLQSLAAKHSGKLLSVGDLGYNLQLLRFSGLRRTFYEDLWRKAADATGCELTPTGYGYLRVQRGTLVTFVERHRVMLDDHLTLNIMGNKAITHGLLREKGIRVPQCREFTLRSLGVAEAFLEEHGGPLVVKPVGGTGGGRGVTTSVRSKGALRRAALLAARYHPRMLAEEQVEGASYRLLYLDGRFLDAVRRDPPHLTGDGRKSVRQLIRQENKRRLSEQPVSALSPLRADADCAFELGAQSLSLSARVEAGRRFRVKRIPNENVAAENHNVRGEVHPELIAMGGKLAGDLGVRFAGLDVIAQDISALPAEGDIYVNEVNTTPGLHHHYLIAEQERVVPVAEILLNHLFSTEQGVIRL